jgi:hypothetical protein
MSPQGPYRYDPHWRVLAFIWALAASFAILAVAGWHHRTFAFGASALFLCLGVPLTLRRVAFTRSLVVDEDGIWLPTGFMRVNVRRVLFAEVTAVWESFLPFTAVLCLRSRDKTFEVLSTLMPDAESYQAVGRYILTRVKPSNPLV